MSYNKIFNPNSVAVVGASIKPKTVGNDLVINLIKSKIKIYPINPKYDLIEGLTCFSSLETLPEVPDLVVIAVPAIMVVSVLESMVKIGSKSAIIISAGFGETDENGKILEHQVEKICLENQVTLVGVNCLGVINATTGLNASFAQSVPGSGNVALIAQSGALCTAVIDYSKELGLGFSKIVSIGNKTTLSEIELIKYLDQDPETKVIMMYLEDLKDPQSLLQQADLLTKPVLVLKSGRTKSGQRATSSHTGALSGEDTSYDALFRQSGFIRCNTIEELFNYSLVFSNNSPIASSRVAIVTNAGGPGSIASDVIDINGLSLANISAVSKMRLAEFLPKSASLANPIDLLGDALADSYEKSIKILLEDNEIDSILVILTPQTMTEPEKTAQAIIGLKATTSKPIVVSFMGSDRVKTAQRQLIKNNITQIIYPDNAVKALGQLAKFSNRSVPASEILDDIDLQQKSLVRDIICNLDSENKEGYLENSKVEKILKLYDLPVIHSKTVTTLGEAVEFVKNQNTNVVMKIVSPTIIHKSDVGGVELDVNLANLERKYSELLSRVKKNAPEAEILGVNLSEQIDFSQGYEMIIGVKDEQDIGKSIMFGLGGVLVEVLKDVTFSIAPIDLDEAKNMITRIRSHEIFKGVRGRPQTDTDSLIKAILNISKLVGDFPEILELDINPLILLPMGQGCKIVDARIRIKI